MGGLQGFSFFPTDEDRIMTEELFPSNSKTTNPGKKTASADKPEKKVEKVVSGEVVQRKKPLGKRMKETFFSGADNRTVMEYVLNEIIKPMSKDMFMDVMNAGFERKLYGEVRSRGRRNYVGAAGAAIGGYTAYNRVTSGHPVSVVGPEPRIDHRARARHDLGELVIPTRAEAMEVLENLYALISQYEVATVADFYQLCDVPSQFTDNSYGWLDLHGARVDRVRGGYVLALPRPVELN